MVGRKRSESADLVGKKIFRLTVIEYVKIREKSWAFRCSCECGNEVFTPRARLLNGEIKSCGCYRSDNSSALKHGLVNHPLNGVWRNMKSRCFNPNVKEYKWYGERGIGVYKPWINNFKAFYDYCMTLNYEDGLQLDRIDGDGNYEPGNLRFVTSKKNNNNRKNTKKLLYKGQEYSLVELFEAFPEVSKVSRNVLRKRLNDSWDLERALNTPYSKYSNKPSYNGHVKLPGKKSPADQ